MPRCNCVQCKKRVQTQDHKAEALQEVCSLQSRVHKLAHARAVAEERAAQTVESGQHGVDVNEWTPTGR